MIGGNQLCFCCFLERVQSNNQTNIFPKVSRSMVPRVSNINNTVNMSRYIRGLRFQAKTHFSLKNAYICYLAYQR